MAELQVFDPEGDVLLILERFLKEDDLVESVDEGESESIPEGDFVSEKGGRVEDEAPPLLVDVPDWPESKLGSVLCESQAEIPGVEVDGITKPESSVSAFSASRETKRRVQKVQMRVHQSILSSLHRPFELV